MALTFAIASVAPLSNQPEKIGQHRERIVTITPSGTYTTGGGDTLTAATLGFAKVLYFDAEPTSDFHIPLYDYAASKIKFYETGAAGGSTGAEKNDAGAVGAFRARIVGI